MKSLWDTCVKDLDILRKRVPYSSTEDCEKAIAHIRKTLAEHDTSNCFGIAANQLGMNIRACLLTVPKHYFENEGENSDKIEIEFHNPRIFDPKGHIVNQEWCYSLPKDEPYIVKRYKEVSIQDDKNGVTKLKGVAAYAAQHEIDHLDGKITADKGTPAGDFMAAVRKKATPKNAPCSCGSGKKFKRCCGK